MSSCKQQVNVGLGLLGGAFRGESVPGAEKAGVRRKGNFVKLIVFTALHVDMKTISLVNLSDLWQGAE